MAATGKTTDPSSSVGTRFAFATMFMGLWVLMNWVCLLGALLLACWGCLGLFQQYRRTPAQHRRTVMVSSVISALVFLVVAQVAVGYNAGKYMAQQDGPACAAYGPSTPNNSIQRTRCARR